MYYTYGNTPNYNVSLSNGSSVWIIISAVLAVVGALVLYFIWLRPDKKENNKFLAWLKDFLNFKKILLEAILKITYAMLAIFISLSSFALISENFVAFLMVLVFGNVVIRIVYEFSLMLMMIWHNTNDINKKMK